MAGEDAGMDADAARPHRGETDDQRLDRNWNELLQELRVVQTGVQILTGFLLTLPFTQPFAELSDLQQRVYLSVLAGSVLATGLLVAPVAFHRVLFRHGLRTWIVRRADQCAKAGLSALALTIVGVVWFVFDIVAGRAVAGVAAGTALTFFAVLWGLTPWWLLRGGGGRRWQQGRWVRRASAGSRSRSTVSLSRSCRSGAIRHDPHDGREVRGSPGTDRGFKRAVMAGSVGRRRHHPRHVGGS